MAVRNDKCISVIGLGVVGLTTAVGFRLKGYKVIGIDIDPQKVVSINEGVSPIYEQGLNSALKKIKLKATQDFEQVLNSHVTFLCGGTPGKNDGAIDLQFVNRPAEQLGEVLKKKDDAHLVVVRSTVIPGTTESTILPYFKDMGKVGICVNPEFLRMGTALEDFMTPSRIIIGENDPKWGEILARIYSNFNRPTMRTDMKTAEMIKYASNACLATKISFINEIGNLCKEIGIDAHVVAQGMEFDDRIGHGQLRAGIGFGGSCFPKDLAALVAQGMKMGYDASLLKQVIEVNREQPLRMLQLLKKHVPSLKGKVIGILGLAFKPDTDDTRESRAIPIIDELLNEGAQIRAYDPQGMSNFHKLFPNIKYTNAEDVLDSDAVLILTEWDEFCALDYRKCIVIDGRKVEAAKKARIYEGVCW